MRLRWCFVVAALSVAGCTVGPKYHVPTVPTAPAYKEPPPPEFKEVKGWKPGQPSDGNLRSTWWDAFNSPELNALEAQVNTSSQTLKAAEARFREARALIRLNRAGLFPSVSTAPSITSNHTSNNAPNSVSRRGQFGEFFLPIDVNYELDAWGRVRRSIAAAREETQASAADLETIRLSLHAEVAIDYFELRSLDAQKQLLDDTLVAYRKALDLTKSRYDAGLAPKAELAQAQTQLESTRAGDIGVSVNRAQYEHAIAVLVGQTPETLNLRPVPLKSTPPEIPIGVPSELLQRRPDVASAERRAAEANDQVGIARAAWFPDFLITATGGLESGSFVDWLTWPSRFWAVGPSVLQPIFDAGRRHAASEQSLARYDEAVANYRQAALVAFQQVEDNLSTLRILEEQAKAQRAAVQAAQESLDASMSRYKGGLVTFLEVAVAQTTALKNESTEVDLLRQRMDASVLLIKALGGGWDTSKLPQP